MLNLKFFGKLPLGSVHFQESKPSYLGNNSVVKVSRFYFFRLIPDLSNPNAYNFMLLPFNLHKSMWLVYFMYFLPSH